LTSLTGEDFGLSFVDNGMSAVRWRFLLAFQCLPALLLLAGIKFLPDSPRYLASVGRFKEAREVHGMPFTSEMLLTLFKVLEHVRGATGPEVKREFQEVDHPPSMFGSRNADLANLDLCRR
jgi:hypothetical protein